MLLVVVFFVGFFYLLKIWLTKANFLQVKSKKDVNKVTKSECGPDKVVKAEMAESIRSRKLTNEMELDAPPVLGAPFESDPDEADHITKLVSDALAVYSQQPASPKYG